MRNVQTVLITGASSGIGYELAELFARDSYDLVLVARSEEKLKALGEKLKARYEVSYRVIPKDLLTVEACEELHDTLQRERIDVEVLVNNAGFGLYGRFSQTNAMTEIQMIRLNVVTLTYLTKLFLKDMMRKNRGRILNVASTAAFQPGPLMAVYYATKAYVLSFSEAIAEELRSTGITVTALCPGPTQSRFQETAGLSSSLPLLGKGMVMSAERVAREGYRGLMRGRRLVICGSRNKLLVQSLRISPRRLAVKIVKKLQETRKK